MDPALGQREWEHLLPGLGELEPNVPIHSGCLYFGCHVEGWQHRSPQAPTAEPTLIGPPQTGPHYFSCSLLHRPLPTGRSHLTHFHGGSHQLRMPWGGSGMEARSPSLDGPLPADGEQLWSLICFNRINPFNESKKHNNHFQKL